MKTKIFLLMLLAVALFSCQKEKTDSATVQDVTFTALQLTPDVGLKSTADVIPCKPDVPDFAAVLINGTWYYPALFTLDGKLYTQAIKLPVGAYTVTEFFLYKNVGGTTGYLAADGDIIVFATPQAGVDYDEFITHHLPFTFTVEAFKKAQIEIEVLCFQDHLYTDFGFFWFQVTEIIVREQCFFGDLCVEDPELYLASLYNSQVNGVQIDMPAIFYVHLTKDGVDVPYFPYGNAYWFGEGEPLCIAYPDNLSIEGELFELSLYVLRLDPITGEFVYFHYFTWTFEDEEMIPTGEDGVVDFVIGFCNMIDPDELIDPDDIIPPPLDTSCGTAYAYNADPLGTCFLDLPYGFNRWGWTIGPLGQGTWTFPLYASAGQCNLANGTLVGSVVVTHTGGDVTVTYNITVPGFAMYAAHIYAGTDILPQNNGDYTVAPGQYPWVEGELMAVTTYTHTFTGLPGDVYIVAHAVVCGIYP